MMKRRVVVVGSGIAGLVAAIELSAIYDVTLVTKAELTESNTRWAQGGIAAVMFSDDSIDKHIADTLKAGAGLCNREAVHVLCTEGPARIRDLVRLGVQFDRSNGQFARGLEAAHSYPRILHANGDATGFSIEMALVNALKCSTVKVMEHTFACDLILESDRVAGLEVLSVEGERRRIAADAIVLASGGAGQLFLHTTNPSCATGDGVALALRAGAQLADLEFYQFHPTALDAPETFLISEAVRGEGAVLLDNKGQRFMQNLHADGELAPRDVVARGIALQMAAQGGEPVRLDASRLGSEFLRKRFPTIDSATRRLGFDWASESIPVTPAAHYWMGGVRTDMFGRTSVAGLLAVGEVACTGVHGANRLASNSLLESLVFAWRCAKLLLSDGYWKQHDRIWAGASEGVSAIHDQVPLYPSSLVDRRGLQLLMWQVVGIERNGEDLEAALQQIENWRVSGKDVQSLETSNMLQIARVMVSAALTREESRGAHFRSDFRETSSVWQESLTYMKPVAVAC